MSFLLKKSNQNELAIGILIDKLQYAPVAHCAYYSCLQKMVYVLKDYYTNDYDYIQKEYRARRMTSLHNSYIKHFVDKFRHNHCEDKRDAMELDDKIKELKGYRTKSDYDDEDINEQDILKIKEVVEKIHRLIKQHMQV